MLRSPSLRLEFNPLEGGFMQAVKKTDNLAGAVLITKLDLDGIIKHMKSLVNNEDRLAFLEEEKTSFLFSSLHLKELIDITPSVKTRLAMIMSIGPRLTDPRAKIDYFLELFRFSEEKEKVQEVLKTRTHVLSSSLFRQSGLSLSPMGGYSDPAETVAPKPFIAIPGLAKARERVVKVPPKIRKSTGGIEPHEGSKMISKGTPLEKVCEIGPISSSPPRAIAKGITLEKAMELRSRSTSPKLSASVAASEKSDSRTTSPKVVGRLERVGELRTNPNPTAPAAQRGSLLGSNGTYSVGATRTQSPPQRTGPKNGEHTKKSPNGVHTIGEDSDSDHLPDTMAAESKKGDSRVPSPHPSPPPPIQTKRLIVDTTVLPSPSLVGKSVPASPSVSANSSGKGGDYGSAGKVGRMIKSLVTRGKFSPKFTPLALGGNLIPGQELEEAVLIQTKLETDLQEAAAAESSGSASGEKKHENGATNGSATHSSNCSKGPKKSVRMASPTKKVRIDGDNASPPRAQRNALSMSSVKAPPSRQGSVAASGAAAPLSPDRAVDIYASNEVARSWRKSTRFVNVKSLAYDFDRLKERGEKQQKRRSQTPDRRQQFPKSEEKHEEDEEDDEEKDHSTEPAPWYLTDKLAPNRSKRGVAATRGVDTSASADGMRRRSANDSISERSNSGSGICTPSGAPIQSGLTRELSYYQMLPIEGPVETAKDGTPLFRYQELVRRNFMHTYEGVNQSDLENYLIDSDFLKNFGMSKAEFHTQPLWRKIQKKKSLNLF